MLLSKPPWLILAYLSVALLALAVVLALVRGRRRNNVFTRAALVSLIAAPVYLAGSFLAFVLAGGS